MAFHFNWSPLIADTDRVREMLTSSLNKSPKPPIIVDDIVVNELNLGGTPPSLEILEIGDLAEDRFRGIFKVRYEGDAFLTLKTRVQANPLNTFLSTKPSFASPSPLAAGSGLTIPLQITLSDIRLSGFVILVFSKQKGITLVFRNDPLESLKVSSTFDSIPFVRDYLQKTIEGQLRVLFMEDLPAIIHRLSLRVFSSEYQGSEVEAGSKSELDAHPPVDPFASPAQSAVDVHGSFLDGSFSLDAQGETYASYSQKNLLRLAALTESQRTLSLFTPSIRDTVYRAWASTADRSDIRDGTTTPTIRPTTVSRIQSSLNTTHSTLSSAGSQASDAPSHATRPSLATMSSMSTSYSLGSGRTRSHATRKRKNRVVNLRRNEGGATDGGSDARSTSSGYDESVSRSESVSVDESTGPISPEVSTVPTSISHLREREGKVHTPLRSPQKKVGFQRARALSEDAVPGAQASSSVPPRQRPVTPRNQHLAVEDNEPTPRASMYLPEKVSKREKREKRAERPDLPRMQTLPDRTHHPAPVLPRSSSEISITDLVSAFPAQGGSTGGILEQAWMMKMASEIAKKVAEEKGKQGAWQGSAEGEDAEGPPPPAYGS